MYVWTGLVGVIINLFSHEGHTKKNVTKVTQRKYNKRDEQILILEEKKTKALIPCEE